MRTTLRLLPILLLAACADPTTPRPSITGEWYLSATAGSECRMIARIHMAPDGQTGAADVGFSRQEEGRSVAWGGTGFHVRVEYPHLYLSQYDLHATSSGEDAMRGTWTCEGTPGTWEMDREDE